MASGLVPRSHGPAPEPRAVEYCLRTIYLSAILLSVGSSSLSISSSSSVGFVRYIEKQRYQNRYLHFSIYLTYYLLSDSSYHPVMVR